MRRPYSPEHRAAQSARMRAKWQDPDYRARQVNAINTPEAKRRSGDAARARYSDPAFNPLAALTPDQRAEYTRLVKSYRYTRPEALRMVGRGDLV